LVTIIKKNKEDPLFLSISDTLEVV